MGTLLPEKKKGLKNGYPAERRGKKREGTKRKKREVRKKKE